MRVEVDFGDDGLVPAVAQDSASGEVLMLAYVDREALARTRETGVAHYYSRSREELWRKGDSSGYTQQVEEVRVDCDADALLYLVEQTGGACHTGYRSCFHRALVHPGEADGSGAGSTGTDEASLPVSVVGERAFDPDEVYDE